MLDYICLLLSVSFSIYSALLRNNGKNVYRLSVILQTYEFQSFVILG